MMVWMLVRRQQLPAIGAGMVAVIRFDKAVGWQIPGLAVSDKVAVYSKQALVLHEVNNLHGGAWLIIVVELRALASLLHAFINCGNPGAIRLGHQEHIHVDIAKGGSVVSERAVTDRGSGDRGKPSVEDSVFD